MPIYEYECEACGYRHEVIQKISDEPLRDCPSCDEPALKKLVSAAGFRLSGSGWYETDFKKSGRRRNLTDDGSKDSSKASAAKSSGSAKSSKAKKSTSKSSSVKSGSS
ncbi:MAG: zinc ribbon domain-containing protein [Gammaproteobacteria bacterium]|nr:zinc ribbon domain-containing protein [Gammaproteobacteria bacterium]